MVYSDSSTEDGIVQEIDRICGTTATVYTLKAKTARVNQALDRFFYLALLGDGLWQFDDTNQTTLPIGTSDLVSGQLDYSFASDLLMISKVLIKDPAGNWAELPQLDQNQSRALGIYAPPISNPGGTPSAYDILGNSLLLDPIPNYASTGGLKVVFKRNASKFVSTDTTKVPGIPSLFHNYLCRYAALQWAIEKRLVFKNDLAQLIQVDELAIQDFLANRNKATPGNINPKYRSSR